ncbi:F-box protein At3g28330-like [Prunus avium]|uniref:F-box protein At3g28330-like n=1 Tax=Prunus avium TaxID=42229 RepID=A0A6P5SND3_PRUAV|nr:F-box protein At3g28330-like [Prunus avium]
MCQFSGNNEDGFMDRLSVWELKDDQVDNDSNWHLVRRISLNGMFSQNPVIMKWRDQGCWRDEIMLLAFDPNDDDILYRVVRIIPESPGVSFQFKAEIFSSETGKWTETIVLCPRSFYLAVRHEGVAYNGMLYWMSSSAGSLIGLDPYSNKNVDKKYNCRFIDNPEDDQVPVTATFDLPSVCRVGGGGERLRMCQFSGNNEDGFMDRLSVWELKDDQVDNDSNWHLVRRISLNGMFSQNPVIMKWRDQSCWRDEIMLLAFDPNDDDILYVDFIGHVVMFNINDGGRITCYLSTPRSYGTIQNHHRRAVFPFVIPWWPTPVTTRQKQSLSSNHM